MVARDRARNGKRCSGVEGWVEHGRRIDSSILGASGTTRKRRSLPARGPTVTSGCLTREQVVTLVGMTPAINTADDDVGIASDTSAVGTIGGYTLIALVRGADVHC